jgi:selenocysteine lyase/cysteine desulfurase
MIYLNHAGYAPTRIEAVRAYDATLKEFNELLFSSAGVRWYRAKLDESRQKVAQLLQVADPNSIAFNGGATTACRLLMGFLPFREYDTVLTTDQEHPGILRFLYSLSKRGVQLKVIRCDSTDSLLRDVEREFTAKVAPRLALISHVSYLDVRVLPIEDIGDLARRTGVPLIVDGAQAVGHIDVRLPALGCDAYFFSGHKWCRGPMGTGALVVSDTLFRKYPALALEQVDIGKPVPQMFEGTMNVGLIAGLAEACCLRAKETNTTHRLSAVRERFKRALHQIPGLDPARWEGSHAPGILSFRVGNRAPDRLVNYLATRDIAVKPFPPPETASLIRLSWSAEMKEQDVIYTAKSISDWMSSAE